MREIQQESTAQNEPTCQAPDDSLAQEIQLSMWETLDQQRALATWALLRLMSQTTNWDYLLDLAEALSAVVHCYDAQRDILKEKPQQSKGE